MHQEPSRGGSHGKYRVGVAYGLTLDLTTLLLVGDFVDMAAESFLQSLLDYLWEEHGHWYDPQGSYFLSVLIMRAILSLDPEYVLGAWKLFMHYL